MGITVLPNRVFVRIKGDKTFKMKFESSTKYTAYVQNILLVSFPFVLTHDMTSHKI